MADFGAKIGNIRMKDTAASRAMLVGDSMANLLTGMGGSLDASSHSFYRQNFIDQNQIETAYRTSAYTKRVHLIPVIDSIRAWRTFQAEDADITAIETEERRVGLRDKVKKAELLARLYGGAVMLMGTKDGDLSQELDVNTIAKGDLRYLHAISKNRIFIEDLILDPGSPYYGQPSRYLITGGLGSTIPVHPSRIVRYIHGDLPDDVLERQSGWGDPLIESLWSVLTNADTAQGSFASLLSKTLIDTVYIPGLTEMAATTEGEEMLKKRFLIAKAFESILHVKMMDSPATSDGVGEKWETRQAVWQGIPDMGRMFLQMLAGASGIPLTRLMGSSADGMNATGRGDEAIYFESIAAGQEMDMRPRLDPIDQVLVRSALGSYPGNLWYDWNPLAVDSDATKAENALKRSNAIKNITDSQTVPPEVMQEIVKNQIIESGEFPGAEQAYDDYEAGNLEPLIEEDETPDDPLIPVDPTTGAATMNRESRLFAANDCMKRLLADGMSALDAFNEAHRLTDAAPRSLYVSRKVLNADELQAWMTEQGLGELQPNPHVTVLYSREPVDWLKMGNTWVDRDQDGTGVLLIAEGGPRVVEPLGDRTAVLMFANTDMQWRHEEMVRLGASHDWPDYVPHISLTGEKVSLENVKPYRGKIRLGPEIFEEIKDKPQEAA